MNLPLFEAILCVLMALCVLGAIYFTIQIGLLYRALRKEVKTRRWRQRVAGKFSRN